MTILEVYDRYQIMPNLQLHQLRVAAVAKQVCDSFTESLNTRAVIEACLLHDMGNILKFDLTAFPEFVEPQGQRYWQDVQEQFRRTYGVDEHQASLAIARELGCSELVQALIASIGFDPWHEGGPSVSTEEKVCEYADCRVAPQGIVTLSERLLDLSTRYSLKYPGQEQELKRHLFQETIKRVEAELQAATDLDLQTIAESGSQPVIEELKNWPLSTG